MLEFYTHGGVFHLDEMVAISLIRISYPNQQFRVHRVNSVDGIVEDANVFILDIGGGRYDHHQLDAEVRPIDPKFPEDEPIRYAAAGLVFREFGRDLIPDEKIRNEFEKSFILPIDAHDNGQSVYRHNADDTLTEIQSTFSQIVSVFNPMWDEDRNSVDFQFKRALELVYEVVDREIDMALSRCRASRMVDETMRYYDGNGIVIMNQYFPWSGTEIQTKETTKICVFPSLRGGWNAQLIPNPKDRNVYKVGKLPEGWAGNPQATGVDGCTFVHNNGFMAAFTTKEAAVKYARKVIEYNTIIE